MLKERVSELKSIRDQARADAERAEGALDRAGPSNHSQALKTFASHDGPEADIAAFLYRSIRTPPGPTGDSRRSRDGS
jgi:hypothetical protein